MSSTDIFVPFPLFVNIGYFGRTGPCTTLSERIVPGTWSNESVYLFLPKSRKLCVQPTFAFNSTAFQIRSLEIPHNKNSVFSWQINSLCFILVKASANTMSFLSDDSHQSFNDFQSTITMYLVHRGTMFFMVTHENLREGNGGSQRTCYRETGNKIKWQSCKTFRLKDT